MRIFGCVKAQQFPLTTRSIVALQRADPLDRDESIALAMDEERYKGDTSVMQPESGRQRELLVKAPGLKNRVEGHIDCLNNTAIFF